VVLSTATTVAEACALEEAGIDAIIAQGWEAGGHRGSHVPRAPADGTGGIALVPQIADAVKVPVIAAGGIADGRGIAAALALGASGIQIGTGFLRCPEAGTDAPRRALLATARDTDTIMTDSVSGRAARACRSAYALEMESAREPLPDFPSLYELAYPLVEKAGTREASFHLYGQSAALARDLPAGILVSKLVEETESVLRRLVPGGR
jgi:nitronate monooxygenase